MRLTSAVTSVLAVLLAIASAGLFAGPARAGGDGALQTYKKRWVKDAFLSDREELLGSLVETGNGEAREAIAWCLAREREFLEAAVKESDKAGARLKPIQEEFDEQFRKYAEDEAKKGNPPPTGYPANWQSGIKLNAARADAQYAEKKVAEERLLRDLAIESHGICVDKMPQPQQDAYRATLVDAKGPLLAKEWLVRAEHFEMLRAARAAWVTKILLDAVAQDPDPRALVPILEGLGGRDAKLVVPAVVPKLADARWVVRAAALGALERTPSKESIDAIVARAPSEEGRLRDDCLRILIALTGADVARTPEAWKQWWTANREAWTGPPPVDKGGPTVEKLLKKSQQAAGKTGFFGIETNSKRLCYVIDVSGSMNEKASDKGKETRAELAKAELIRSLRGLEDGSWFGLILFSSDVRPWKLEMTVASEATRKAAVDFVQAAVVVGATNTYGALEMAFTVGEPSKPKASDPYADSKLDTIVFLSDGKPTHGRSVRVDEIRGAVKEWNKRRRVTIHSIAFGKDADFDFMEKLAQDTGGVFVSQ